MIGVGTRGPGKNLLPTQTIVATVDVVRLSSGNMTGRCFRITAGPPLARHIISFFNTTLQVAGWL